MKNNMRIGLLMTIALLLTACGPVESLTATATPMSYYGIDEPAALEGVRFTCSMGVSPSTSTVDVMLTFNSAEERDRLSSLGEDEDRVPSAGHIFYTLNAAIEVLGYAPCNDLEAIGSLLTLSCGGETFSLISYGLDVGQGGAFEGFTYTFEIPDNPDRSTCEVQLPDGSSVPIGQAFE
jgi:hypothetical protein